MYPVFYIEETNKYEVSLRRYTHSDEKKCPSQSCGHDMGVLISVSEFDETPSSGYGDSNKMLFPQDDSRWPAQCECGYLFQLEDKWQVNYHNLYKKHGGDEMWTLYDKSLPIGAVWNASWMLNCGFYTHKTEDNRILCVKTPGGDWNIDAFADNCTRKGEEHACWVRHGKPEDGTLHVDKNGDTCAAGAGSIIIGGWHGFLHNGQLLPC
jgi:hypothetical protein